MDIDKIDIRRLDFGLLLVFRELLRKRRTTLVAQHLGLSQSAVSHALARLRDLLGDPLFLRRSDGLKPTHRALALLPQVEALLDQAQDLLCGIRKFDPMTSTRLFRIAAHDFTASILSPALRQAFAVRAPGLRFTIQYAVGKDALEMLQGDILDVAVGRFPVLLGEVDATLLGKEDYLVATRGDGRPAAMDLGAYLARDHIMVSFRGGLRGTVDEALDELGLERRVCASVPTFFTALGTAADSDLVATVPRRLAKRYAGRFGLATFPVPFAIPTFSTVAIVHSRNRTDPAIAWLTQLLSELWN